MNKRTFTPYELAQLAKHGLDAFAISETVDKDIPVEYITGYCEFRNNDFHVTQDTLIPRIETEEIVEYALEVVSRKGSDMTSISFADIGTGSGAIGISFAKELAERGIRNEGVLVDISDKALQVAEKNSRELLRKNHLTSISLINSDLLESIPVIQCDVIFANLPYIPSGTIPTLDVSVKNFEPIVALDGGLDGMDVIRKLLYQAPQFLKPDGVLLLEVNDSHTDALEFEDMWTIQARNDSFNRNRFWIVRKKE